MQLDIQQPMEIALCVNGKHVATIEAVAFIRNGEITELSIKFAQPELWQISPEEDVATMPL